MRCSNDRHAVDVMPENEKVIDPDTGEEGFMIVRHDLGGSVQHWGKQVDLPGAVVVHERMTRMSLTPGFDADHKVAGYFWVHARKDTEGVDLHECWLPIRHGVSDPDEPVWTLLEDSNVGITLEQDMECVCGQRGYVRAGKWSEYTRRMNLSLV